MPADDNVKVTKRIIRALDNLLTSGDWESSLFLKTIGKRIRGLRDKGTAALEEQTGEKQVTKPVTEEQKTGRVLVYISLYQAVGIDMQRWESAVRGLPKTGVTRPIYREELHIQERIRHRPDTSREAYAAVYVNESDIIPPHKGRVGEDSQGHELLNLKQGALRLENIVEFVHQKQRYTPSEGRLIKKEV